MARIEEHNNGIRHLIAQAREFFADGVVTTTESGLLIAGLVGLLGTAAVIGNDMEHINGAMQLIGILANTADPTTPWFDRRLRQVTRGLDAKEEEVATASPSEAMPGMAVAAE